jgi:hypothetical protein
MYSSNSQREYDFRTKLYTELNRYHTNSPFYVLFQRVISKLIFEINPNINDAQIQFITSMTWDYLNPDEKGDFLGNNHHGIKTREKISHQVMAYLTFFEEDQLKSGL